MIDSERLYEIINELAPEYRPYHAEREFWSGVNDAFWGRMAGRSRFSDRQRQAWDRGAEACFRACEMLTSEK